MRLLFAGTPETAVPSFEALLATDHEIVAVLTRPDARVGRGRRLRPSPVAQAAEEAGIEVLKPTSTRDPELANRIAELAPDCAPVVAYGGLLPKELLDLVPRGWINLHFSLLPQWRGAAPVQHAIMAGDSVTGASTFIIEEGLDTGPVIGVLTETIRPRDTSGQLLERLADAGAHLLVASIDAIAAGHAVPEPQSSENVSHAPMLHRADGQVRWQDPAIAIDRRIRACTPAPGAWTTLPDGTRLGLGPLRETRATPEIGEYDLNPGQVRVERDRVIVGTGAGAIALGDVVPAGKRSMAAADWARGARLADDTHLGKGETV
ncbi:MAG TPA: methionyl-tRNA formyltransferase [Actinomycetales bacterium]|nr:methionyl-tRNA formyltransferase [Actinomycetales bacterium]